MKEFITVRCIDSFDLWGCDEKDILASVSEGNIYKAHLDIGSKEYFAIDCVNREEISVGYIDIDGKLIIDSDFELYSK